MTEPVKEAFHSMEIERKFLVNSLPFGLEGYPCHRIEQAYLCTDPVLRIRRKDDAYIFTYKGAGFLKREEYEFPLLWLRPAGKL